MTGAAAVRTWSGHVTPKVKPFEWGFSLTWLSDNKTLAVGIATTDAMAGATAAVHYLNTASPSSSLAKASRTVTLSFPAKKAKAGTPDGCYGAPVATSDGQRVLCSGAATYPVNAGGATEVGLWVFSARTGMLTAAWNKHTICCALSSTDFPRILWVSPHGTLLIAQRNEHGEPGGAAVPAHRRRHAAAAPLEGPDPPPGPGQHHRAVHRLVTRGENNWRYHSRCVKELQISQHLLL